MDRRNFLRASASPLLAPLVAPTLAAVSDSWKPGGVGPLVAAPEGESPGADPESVRARLRAAIESRLAARVS